MKRMVSIALSGLLLASCASAPASVATAPSPVRASVPGEQRPPAELQVLFWDQATQRDRFARMEDYFAGLEAAPAPTPRHLSAGRPFAPDLRRALDEAFDANHAVGLMVLQDGRVRYARYANGFSAERRWTSFSVAKSFTSALLGAALKDGAIASLDDPATRYLPALRGTAYDGVTVGQIAAMTSGVAWNENYADPASDVARMLLVEPQAGEPQSVTYARSLRRAEPLGQGRWRYNTLETNLLGDIVEAATGRRLADYAREKIVVPAGFAGPLFWMTDLTGRNIGGCCLSLRLADYARFGQWVLEGGRGTVSADWIARSTAPATRFEQRPGFGYGLQWWTYPEGFGAQGIFGQGITIVPEAGLVIAMVSNQPQASGGPERAAWQRLTAQLAAAPRR
ncbi:class A beta-lactamase-related serine hydrolase [Erythrobacteraceae bacterium CFH 75059]|uniref:serine hydrolase domain-containing protein n=1 Tax=Qipengyuania thermophila TaxID=2509361 RepID=UPI0010211389|nr:serine hydrolase domain-containing protein [Qipengyuania thermophila]TCD05338.1 class A beta-lactamase-related serine hydrolase [Erythrobacteraceae bacterium CFH 75059]